MSIVYRTIDPDNFQEAYKFNLFWEYSWRDSSSAYVADSENERNRKTEALIANLTRSDRKYHALAAFDDRAMAGVISLDRMIIDKRPACHVQGLWVHPDYRGRGIARRLKELSEEWARAMGSEFMDSNVRVDNPTMIRLNEQMGYSVARNCADAAPALGIHADERTPRSRSCVCDRRHRAAPLEHVRTGICRCSNNSPKHQAAAPRPNPQRNSTWPRRANG